MTTSGNAIAGENTSWLCQWIDDTGCYRLHMTSLDTKVSTQLEPISWKVLVASAAWQCQMVMKTCHMCQIHQTDKWHIPPVVAYPAPLFSKVYIDTFHLPKSNGFKYIVHAHCSMSAYLEFKMLRHENVEGITCFIFEHIICCWGSLREIVTDNGPTFLATWKY